MKYRFIREHEAIFPIEKMCRVLSVSSSGYYKYKRRGTSQRTRRKKELQERIREIYFRSKQRYGSPRITAELRSEGPTVSRVTVARYMKELGLRSKLSRKYKATTDSRHTHLIVANVLERKFSVNRPSLVWVSDITYIPAKEGFLYLTVIVDLYDRKVIGWSISNSLRANMTSLPAWRMAVRNRPVRNGMIFHSDRGVQYACDAFANTVESFGVVRSMSRKGNCWDNAVVESFFKTLKTELIYGIKLASRDQTEKNIFEYIEIWYNRNRRHSALGYKTILELNASNNFYKQVA